MTTERAPRAENPAEAGAMVIDESGFTIHARIEAWAKAQQLWKITHPSRLHTIPPDIAPLGPLDLVTVSAPYGRRTHSALSEVSEKTLCGMSLNEAWAGGFWALCPDNLPTCSICLEKVRELAGPIAHDGR